MTTTSHTHGTRLAALRNWVLQAWPFPFVTPAAFGATPPAANRD